MSSRGQRSDSDHRPLRFAFLLLPQFTLSAFSLFLDTVRLAADERDGSRQVRCRWRVMTLNGLAVQSSCGVEMHPTDNRFSYAETDWLVVVGGLMRTAIHDDDRVVDIIQEADRHGVRIAGVCTGVFSMAAAGLLDDDVCCVSWFHRDELAAGYDLGRIDTMSLFRFGQRHVTCAGGIGAAHVSIEIIRGHFGDDVAGKCAGILLMPRYWTQNIEQPMSQASSVRSTKVRRALRYMESRLDQAVRMDDVAAEVHVSVRHLERLFNKYTGQPPQSAMRALRLEKARSHLVETDWPVIEIALACGFASPSHFAGSFKAAFGVSPSAYRMTAGRHHS